MKLILYIMSKLVNYIKTIENFSDASNEDKLDLIFACSGLSFIFLFAPLMYLFVDIYFSLFMICVGIFDLIISQYILTRIELSEDS